MPLIRRVGATLFAALVVIATGKVAARGAQQPDRPTFSAESELVVMHVSVRDRGGRYVSGLDRDAFTIIDDGEPQSLSMFSAEEVPASVAFLIDNSNSMRPNRDGVIAAALAFAAHSHPRDEVSVITFNEAVHEAFGPAVLGEIQPGAFRSALAQAITARGMTALYDAVLAGLRSVSDGTHTRQVLIVVSDGGDNASGAHMREMLQQVHDSDATVYSVILTDPLSRDSDPKLMRRLAEISGGESYRPRQTSAIPGVLERIATDIRNAYTLAYAPTRTGADGDPRRTVRVRVRSPDGRALTVRTRDGYFARRMEGPRP